MQVLYMHMPELPNTRHIIIGGKHIINTAAPETNIFHRVAQREKKQDQDKKTAQRRTEEQI